MAANPQTTPFTDEYRRIAAGIGSEGPLQGIVRVVAAHDIATPGAPSNTAVTETLLGGLTQAGPIKQALEDTIDGTVAAAVTRVALARMTAALVQAPTRPVPVVAIGSSTTAGGSASAPVYRWVNRLTRILQAAFPNGGVESEVQASITSDYVRVLTPGVHMYNSGEGGTSSASHPTDFESQKIAALAPLLVIHMVGANDYSLQRNPSEYAANVHNRIAYIDARNEEAAGCTHILIHQHERTDFSPSTYTWDKYRDALRGVAALDPARRVFIDANPAFAAYGLPGGADPLTIYNVDATHLTDAGYGLMTDVLRRALDIAVLSRGGASGITAAPAPVAYRRYSDTFTTPGDWSAGYAGDLALGGTAAALVATTTKFAVASGALTIASGGSTTMQGVAFATAGAPDVQTTIDVISLPAAGSLVFGLFRSGAGSADRITITGNATTGMYELRYRLDNVETTVGAVAPLAAGKRIGVRVYRGRMLALVDGAVLLSHALPTDLDPVWYAGLSASSGSSGGSFDNFTLDLLT